MHALLDWGHSSWALLGRKAAGHFSLALVRLQPENPRSRQREAAKGQTGKWGRTPMMDGCGLPPLLTRPITVSRTRC